MCRGQDDLKIFLTQATFLWRPGLRTWSPLAATGGGPGWMCTTAALAKMDPTSSLFSRVLLFCPTGPPISCQMKWWTCFCTREDPTKCGGQPQGSSHKLLHLTASAVSRTGKDSYREQGLKLGEDNLVVGKPRQRRSSSYICQPDTSNI